MKRSDKQETSNCRWRVADICGFEVFDAGGNRLGVLSEVISTAGNDVWVVKYAGKEILVPALKSVVSLVDTDAKKIIVSLPDDFENVLGGGKNAKDAEYDGYRVYED